jgi:hypothetical protein
LAGSVGSVEVAVIEDGTGLGEGEARGGAKSPHPHDGARARGGARTEFQKPGKVARTAGQGGYLEDIGSEGEGASLAIQEIGKRRGAVEVMVGDDNADALSLRHGRRFGEGRERAEFQIEQNGIGKKLGDEGAAAGEREMMETALCGVAHREEEGDRGETGQGPAERGEFVGEGIHANFDDTHFIWAQTGGQAEAGKAMDCANHHGAGG